VSSWVAAFHSLESYPALSRPASITMRHLSS
jgi:hypothetical protein